MGFLNKLWDETLAGPMPDTGLSKLRKYNSFSGTRSTPPPPPPPPLPRAAVDHPDHNQVQVTRSITILRNNNPNPLARNLSIDVPSSEPDSPSCSTPRTPVTPGTPVENFKRPWTRTKSIGPSTTASTERPNEQRSSTRYDWLFFFFNCFPKISIYICPFPFVNFFFRLKLVLQYQSTPACHKSEHI